MKGGDGDGTRERKVIGPADHLRARLGTFQRRVDRALQVIAEARAIGPVGVSFSGGKDSTVVLDLVRRIDPDAPAAFFDSGLELTSTYALMEHYRVTAIRPRQSLYDMLVYGGYWGAPGIDPDAEFDFNEELIYEPSRRFVSTYGLAVVAMGLRADESSQRWFRARTIGRLHRMKSGIWHLCPIQDWTTDDVWAYIASRNLAYNTTYDRMTALGMSRKEQRISTLIDAAAVRYGRFQQLQRIDPDLFNRLAAVFPKLRAYV